MKRGEAKKRDAGGELTRIVVPMTMQERIRLKHQSIDEQRTIGAIAREALGLPAVPEQRAM